MTLKQIHKAFSLKLTALALLASLSGLVFFAPATMADTSCGTETAIIKCPTGQVPEDGSDENPGIWVLLSLVLQIMTAGVGIVAVGGLIYGGILYASAGDASDKVKKAIEVIRNVVIGVLAYVAMYGLINFLIPGGVF